MGIFGDRELCKIHNPHLFKLKEKSLRYFFIQHCSGKWHKGVDAISCNPVATVETILSLCSLHLSPKDVPFLDNIDAAMELATIQMIMNSGDNNTAMSPDYIHTWAKCSLTEPEICDFWEVQH